MKHHVCAVLLFVSSILCAEVDKHVIADKSKRIGRFSHEDSFNEDLFEKVLKHSPVAVKKNIKKLLYPSDEDVIPQRFLLLGGTSNVSTTALAKAIALRCGYDYYVIEASILLQEYREGRQMLLHEVRPIIKQGKPIALIITELPEMADYSGLLASTLWMIIDQCEQYPDVLVIGTSACSKGQLSEDIKERFGENIISVSLDKYMQDRIENEEKSWFERNKTACVIAGSLACFTLATVYVVAQIVFTAMRLDHDKQVAINKFNQNERMLNIATDLYNQFFNVSEVYVLKALNPYAYDYKVYRDRGIRELAKEF